MPATKRRERLHVDAGAAQQNDNFFSHSGFTQVENASAQALDVGDSTFISLQLLQRGLLLFAPSARFNAVRFISHNADRRDGRRLRREKELEGRRKKTWSV